MLEIQHYPIPIDEKIAHLNQDEVEQLFNAYHYSEVKAKELIDKFTLEYKFIGGLRFILKHKESLENSCPKHNVYCWQVAKGRNVWGMPFCPKCNENAWEVLPPDYYERKRKTIQSKQESIYQRRSNEVVLSLEKYTSLEFSLKVLIKCWVGLNKNKESQNLSLLLLYRGKVFPNDQLSREYRCKLESNELIPENRYFIQKIHLDEELYQYFRKGDYLLNPEPMDLYKFWWDLAYHEVLEYLLFELNKKNINISIESEIELVLQYMISSLPVQQCMFATWAAIKDSCSLIAEKNWDLDYVSKIVPEQLKKKAVRIIEGTLKYFPFNRTYHCRVSKLADTFYNEVTQMGDVGFTICPNIDLFNKGEINERDKEITFDDWRFPKFEQTEHSESNDDFEHNPLE